MTERTRTTLKLNSRQLEAIEHVVLGARHELTDRIGSGLEPIHAAHYAIYRGTIRGDGDFRRFAPAGCLVAYESLCASE